MAHQILVALLLVGTVIPMISSARSPTLVSLSHVKNLFEVQAVSLTTFTRSYMTGIASNRIPGGITYDALRGQVFVSYGNNGEISQLRLDGGAASTLIAPAATRISSLNGTAYDWIAQNIFYTSDLFDHIGVCSVLSRGCTRIVTQGVSAPGDIAVHPESGMIFWTELGTEDTPGKIMKATMDGSSVYTLFDYNNNPTGITVDQDQGRIYWSENGSIFSSDLDGNDYTRVVSLELYTQAWGIDVLDDQVYWSNAGSAIFSADKGNVTANGTLVLAGAVNEFYPFMAIVSTSNQPVTRQNDCAFSPCTDICVLTSNSYTCLCPNEHTLDPDDGTVCKKDAEWIMYVSEGTTSSSITVRNLEETARTKIEFVNSSLAGIAADYRKGVAYWSYTFRNGIHSKRYYGGDETENIMITGGVSVRNMALDWITGNVYYTDDVMGHIGVCAPTTQLCAVIADEGVNQPEGIAVDPVNGHVYWAQAGAPVGIYQAGLDGSNTTLLTTYGVTSPSGISIDTITGYIYWIEPLLYRIYRTDVNGSASLAESLTVGYLPLDLHVSNDVLYYSQFYSGAGSIQRQTAIGSTTAPTLFLSAESGQRIHTMTFASPTNVPVDIVNLCEGQLCSHVCVLLINNGTQGYRCVCPLGAELEDDGFTCGGSNSTIGLGSQPLVEHGLYD